MTAKEPRMVLDGIGKLYEAIAKKYGITPRGVVSAVYSLLEKTWFYGDIDVQNSYFGYTIDNSREKPTSSQFIAMIADHASLRAENDPLKTESIDTTVEILDQQAPVSSSTSPDINNTVSTPSSKCAK